jgi:hypothetical protein
MATKETAPRRHDRVIPAALALAPKENFRGHSNLPLNDKKRHVTTPFKEDATAANRISSSTSQSAERHPLLTLLRHIPARIRTLVRRSCQGLKEESLVCRSLSSERPAGEPETHLSYRKNDAKVGCSDVMKPWPSPKEQGRIRDR